MGLHKGEARPGGGPERLDRRTVLRTGGSIAAGLASSLAWSPRAAAAAPPVVKLRLMETSDLHMFVYNYDYYRDRPDESVGFATTASLIRAARQEAPNSLLFDNGDLLQGSPLGDYLALKQGLPPGTIHPMFRAMNDLGFDAATLGNHEFNFGLPFLRKALAGAKFPYVSANLAWADGRPYVPPTAILKRTLKGEDGKTYPLKIGVIGFVPPQITVWDRSNLAGKMTTTDIVAAAEKYVPGLRRQVDLVVALCHAGISTAPRQGGDENAAFYLASVPGIDVIFTGHAHRVFPGPDYAGEPGVDATRGTLNGIPAVMPGYWGSHLGVIDLTLTRDLAAHGHAIPWRVAEFHVEARPIYRRDGRQVVALAKPDPAMLSDTAPEHKATIDYMGQPIGKTAKPIDTYFIFAGDQTAVSVINDAQLWYMAPLLAASPYARLPVLSAAAPFRAGGRAGPDAYTDIAAGPVALKNVADLYTYSNTVQAVKIKGAGLREWLERAAIVFNRIDPAKSGPQLLVNPDLPAYGFDVIAGLTYTIDPTQPPRYNSSGVMIHPEARRIGAINVAGHPLDEAQEFIVVTNNYRASGGGKFPGLDGTSVVLAADDTNRDAIVRYLEAKGNIDPVAKPGWRFAAQPKPLQVALDSGPGARSRLAQHPGISVLGDESDGFTRFVFKLG